MLEVLDLVLRRGLQGRRIPGIVLKLALGHVNPPSWCSIVSEVGLQVGSLGFVVDNNNIYIYMNHIYNLIYMYTERYAVRSTFLEMQCFLLHHVQSFMFLYL